MRLKADFDKTNHAAMSRTLQFFPTEQLITVYRQFFIFLHRPAQNRREERRREKQLCVANQAFEVGDIQKLNILLSNERSLSKNFNVTNSPKIKGVAHADIAQLEEEIKSITFEFTNQVATLGKMEDQLGDFISLIKTHGRYTYQSFRQTILEESLLDEEEIKRIDRYVMERLKDRHWDNLRPILINLLAGLIGSYDQDLFARCLFDFCMEKLIPPIPKEELERERKRRWRHDIAEKKEFLSAIKIVYNHLDELSQNESDLLNDDRYLLEKLLNRLYARQKQLYDQDTGRPLPDAEKRLFQLTVGKEGMSFPLAGGKVIPKTKKENLSSIDPASTRFYYYVLKTAKKNNNGRLPREYLRNFAEFSVFWDFERIETPQLPADRQSKIDKLVNKIRENFKSLSQNAIMEVVSETSEDGRPMVILSSQKKARK